jgi:diguanylate cyclase (GGDEF)-like protein
VVFEARGGSVRRLLRSPLVLVSILGIALASLLWLSNVIAARGQEQADSQARQTAEVVVTAVLAQHLDAGATSSGEFADPERVDLRKDLEGLRREGLLLGLTVWRLDGSLIFSDGVSPSRGTGLSADQRDKVESGEAWVEHGVVESQPSLRVFLPDLVGSDDSPVEAVVEVVLPHDAMMQSIEGRLGTLQWMLGGLFGLLMVGVLWLRSRWIRREKQARHDSLTGLLNRRALYEDAPALLGKASARRPAALLLLDLVEFKSVNDTLGHAAGDELLQQVGRQLLGALRRGDLAVRLGGDEFAVLLTGLADVEEAQQLADAVRSRLRSARYQVADVELAVDASIGVAVAPLHGREISPLLQHADVAMYQAKRGHGGSVVYDPDSDPNSVDQLALVGELRQAVADQEFRLLYQPKLSLPDGSVTSVEALLRWQHPTRGLLAPVEFLPALEASGLMSTVTRWVLREAVHQAASWRMAGRELQVAVNISPRTLLESDLPARVLAALGGADLPPSLLQLEITETAVLTDVGRTTSVLRQLRARGVGVAIDDFGAGYTSLAHLRTLPVAALKLDRTLVTDMLQRPENEAVAQAIIELAHRLGIHVVAEGVETAAVLERLVDLGCDAVQGFVVSAALPPAELEGWLARPVLLPDGLVRLG